MKKVLVLVAVGFGILSCGGDNGNVSDGKVDIVEEVVEEVVVMTGESGVIKLVTGARDTIDVPYTCLMCDSIPMDEFVLKMQKISDETSTLMKNPTSFKPFEMNVKSIDYFGEDDFELDFTYLAKNGYGNEIDNRKDVAVRFIDEEIELYINSKDQVFEGFWTSSSTLMKIYKDGGEIKIYSGDEVLVNYIMIDGKKYKGDYIGYVKIPLQDYNKINSESNISVKYSYCYFCDYPSSYEKGDVKLSNFEVQYLVLSKLILNK